MSGHTRTVELELSIVIIRYLIQGCSVAVPSFYSYRFKCSSAMWDMAEDKITTFSLFTQPLRC